METVTEWTLRKCCSVLIFINLVCILFRTADCYSYSINPAFSVNLWCKHCFFILSVCLYHWSSIRLKAVVLFCLNTSWLRGSLPFYAQTTVSAASDEADFFLSFSLIRPANLSSFYLLGVSLSHALSYFLISILKPNMSQNVCIVQCARPLSVILHLKTTSDVEEGGSTSFTQIEAAGCPETPVLYLSTCDSQ